MRSNVVVVAISQLLLISNTATAQKDSVSIPTRESLPARVWIIPVAIVTSAALDPEIREWALHTHSRSLDRLARSVNPLGTARVLVPGMALTYAGALLTRDESLATGTLNTAVAYIASDLVESVLKPVIGRERPHVEGNSRRFRSFTGNGDWHSFPSAHVAHITSIAQAISMQTQSGSVTALCSSLVALIAWDRVYEDQHWTSDVTATIALSSIISSATVRWMESRHSHSR
jgi:membrane-associated phospholipid phosphatase